MVAVKHVALDADGKIRGKNWKAPHLFSRIRLGVKCRTLLTKFPNGKAYNPGDTNAHDINGCKTKLAADYLDVTYWRLTAYAGGDEVTGSNKTITVSNPVDSISLEWTASGDDLRVSSWVAWGSTLTDQDLEVSYRAGSGTETLTIYNIGVEFRYD